jgi:hypothetical protein
MFVIVGRLQVDGETDVPAVHGLQNQFTITPLSAETRGVVDKPGVRLGWRKRDQRHSEPFPPLQVLGHARIWLGGAGRGWSRPVVAHRFRPLMRMYQPCAEILSGDYVLPAITKAR